ncbi:MAG: NAD(P)/FAD-dependent oxidoreductase [Desulfamplus sp.]|nr:NAD(P)/FAD-dependent oxidoreductase [Desulfamplus sp.]
MKRYLIIGNGIAGTTAAEEIRRHDTEGEIFLITKESLPLYSRIRLPDFLCGKIGEKELIIKNQEWHDKHNIKLIHSVEIEKIDFLEKKVFSKKSNKIDKIKNSVKEDSISQDIDVFEFDSLLLAVGSKSFIPPVKGNEFGSVFSLRTIDDAKLIIKRLQIDNAKVDNPKDRDQIKATQTPNDNQGIAIDNPKEVVVIGGGLLGLEAAAAMIHAGIKVTVVEFCDRLLPRQLDYQGAKLLQIFLEKIGVIFRLGEGTEEILGKISERGAKLATVIKGLKLKPQVKGVKLKSGDIIKADAVLFSAGVRPDLSLMPDQSTTDLDIQFNACAMTNKSISVNKGVVVNERMETSIPSIYAAGDVAEYDGVNLCIWQEAMEQGRVAGMNMAGKDAAYKNVPPSNILKVAGIAVASAGEIDVEGKMESEIVSTESIYKKLVKDENGKIVGCIMVGDTSDFNKIVKQMRGEV